MDWAIRAAFTRIGDIALCRLDPDFAEERKTTESVWRPVGRLAHATLWVVGARLIDLPPALTSILLTVLVIVTIVAAVLALFAVLDLVTDYMQRKAKRDSRRFDDLFLPLANTTAKIAVGILGVIATIAVFNKQLPAVLLGGLGIGGIAIALASQETLSNFLGSITLLFDRPFEVGDRVVVDNIDGTVESLGFRSTRIRTGLDSQVTLPNSKLASSSVNNFGRRKYRQYVTMLGVEYSTPPERIDAFCEGIRELIRRHPHTRKDFYAAYLHDMGANSLDIQLLVFFEVPDYATELRERHRLLTDILRLAASLGVSFAFPTQTLYLQKGEKCEVPDLGDDPPDLSGARVAAKIAGELPNYQDRPGPVKFGAVGDHRFEPVSDAAPNLTTRPPSGYNLDSYLQPYPESPRDERPLRRRPDRAEPKRSALLRQRVCPGGPLDLHHRRRALPGVLHPQLRPHLAPGVHVERADEPVRPGVHEPPAGPCEDHR